MSVLGGRRVLRWLEHATLVFESVVNCLTDSRYNPFYHTGTIAVWLLATMAASGVLLLIIYFALYGFVPDAAFVSIERLNDFWLGRLTRSVHRYAADLAVVAVLLHALRVLAADRFSGSRWLAWVSGILLLVLVLSIGVLGFWLVGDTRAQWLGVALTNPLGGPVAFAFLTNESAQKAFYLFFIILVSHIGLGLFVAVFYWIHTSRVSRAQLLPPRFWLYGLAVALVLLAMIRPAFLASPADFSRLLTDAPIDPIFLLFLPVLQDWGAPRFVGVNLVGWGLVALLPWLYPRRAPKAVVVQEECTGCTLCANDCPYAAIEMHARRDNRPYKTEAIINANRCVSCGVCIGACSWGAIRMGDLTTSALRDRIAGHSRVVFACERHAALGALRSLAPIASAGEQGSRGAGENAPLPLCSSAPLLLSTVPCAGAIHPDLVLCAQQFGVEEVFIVSCLDEDCSNREGSRWLAARLEGTRPPFLSKEADRSRLRVAWVAPDDARGLKRALAPANPHPPQVKRVHFLPGTILLALSVLGVVLWADVPYRPYPVDLGQLKIALAYGGQFREAARPLSPTQMARLPAGVRPEDVLGVERFPVYVELDLDGEPRVRKTYSPAGLRRDGMSYGLEEFLLPPGDHRVEIRLDDRGGAKPQAMYSGVVTVKPGEVRVLSFDSRQQTFVLK